jgi:hypothetical protein
MENTRALLKAIIISTPWQFIDLDSGYDNFAEKSEHGFVYYIKDDKDGCSPIQELICMLSVAHHINCDSLHCEGLRVCSDLLEEFIDELMALNVIAPYSAKEYAQWFIVERNKWIKSEADDRLGCESRYIESKSVEEISRTRLSLEGTDV